ncbi:Methyl-CpG-binding domain protein 1 [Microtus ochrogaster]|uniref:Methyl-CpG-binding domain protein 1 n=1 Tax=Microtus ochrogaster TaxID=79684 RepID=A0A8J6G1Y4_MICOH|nr:Methyl-CpG-binding domain protein 1 [Microtus ochrogaster]
MEEEDWTRGEAQVRILPWVHWPSVVDAQDLVSSCLLFFAEASIAQDWQDCPALGPGWKRPEYFRKSGASCGHSDTYYRSPTGDKIRSKVELTQYVGPACDLTLFDFRQGILCNPAPKTHPLPVPSKKKKKPSKPVKVKKHQGGLQKSDVRKATLRAENKAGAGTAPARCENCGIHLPWEDIRRQRLKILCKDCGERFAFNREQRMFKRVGCGECTACLVKDCGGCSICRLQLPQDVASGLYCKCERRRCLRIVEKSRGRDHLKSGSKVAAQSHSQAQSLPPLPAPQHPEPTELHISDLAPTSPIKNIH